MIANALLMAHHLRLAVTGEGTEFAFLVAVTFTGSTAMGTREGIERFTVDGFRVGVPPSKATFVGAETLLFGPDSMGERGFTLRAENAVAFTPHSNADTAEVVSAAKGLNRVFRNTEHRRYLRVTVAFAAHLRDFLFLLMCHANTSPEGHH